MSNLLVRLLGSTATLSLAASCATAPPPPPPPVPPVVTPQAEPEPVATAPAELSGVDKLPATLELCPRMEISNQPAADGLNIIGYTPLVRTETGIEIAVAPVEEGCFSSGFGMRNGRLHKGIDLYHDAPTAIYAAADGLVRERHWRDDYGYMIVIEHGRGVFTRYAHLESFEPGLEVGNVVGLGEPIAVMGDTASYSMPRHLHYEVLLGEWGAQAGSFALTPVDIFTLTPVD